MTTSWNGLKGVSLAGEYELQQWLGDADHSGAFFLTAFGPEKKRAVLKLIPEEAAAEQQLEFWRWIGRLSHPHLLPLWDCGRAEAVDGSCVFAVFEYPDDSLASAVENRPLAENETREVLTAATDALRYIHSQGLVHTAIDTHHIVAVGNQIKLSSDTLSPPSRDNTTAEDVRALGALAFQLLTRSAFEPGREPDLDSISDPLRSVILHSVEPDPNRRWSLKQVAAALNPAPPAALPPLPAPVRSRADSSEPTARWPFIAAASLLVAFGVFTFARRSAPEPPASVPPPHPVVVSRPPVPPEPVASAPLNRDYWRVIVYTYSAFRAAENKARSINQKWPAARAEVFTPNGSNRSPYLVALGGRMTRADAVALQKTARAKGLPRDTFVRNFSK